MKTGITCDNYKIKRFEKELQKARVDNITIYPITEDTSIITFEVDREKLKDISILCKRVELHFKQGN